MTTVILLLITVFTHCTTVETYNDTDHYNLNQPEKFFLPEALNEVSGISLYNGKSDTIYAVQDELGKLYQLEIGTKNYKTFNFGKSGDYEGLSIAHDMVYILKSNGNIHQFSFQDKENLNIDSVKLFKNLVPKGEYESLYADPKQNRLVVVPKKLKDDDESNIVKVYNILIDSSNNLTAENVYPIDVSEIIKTLPNKKEKKIRPSAIAQHPISEDWYLLASVNKLLIICDKNWKVKEFYPLDPKLYRQPEGICFDQEATLYISNEGSDLNTSNLLKFKYTEKQ